MAELERREPAGENQIVFEHFNDHDDCWYQLRETMVTWIDGRRAKYSVAVDISALKEVQNALAEAHAELSLKNRRLNAALDGERRVMRGQRNFLAMVSHEFRMPLAIIEGAAQLLDIYSRPKEEAADEVAKIQRAVRRMTDLIEVCLADDRLDSAMTSLHLSEVDLVGMLREVCDERQPTTGGGRLVLSTAAGVRLVADLTLLRVAISNLVDNALKYSPPEATVEVGLDVGDGVVTVTVADRGRGIDPGEDERIFEKFFRSPSADGVRGAGLGLFIVRRVADLHQGRVEVKARPGGGSVFALTLPLN